MDSLPACSPLPGRPARAIAAGAAAAAVAAVAALLLALPDEPRAADMDSAALRVVDIPGFGALHLPVPPGWRVGSVTTTAPEGEETDSSPERLATFPITPDTPAHCEMTVSFSWKDLPDPAFNGPAVLRGLVDRMARAALDASIESRYTLREMRGPRGGGYWFALRARVPRKKSQAYLTSGAFGLGNALLRFTFLSPQPDLPEAGEAISLIAGARLDDEPAPAP